MATRREELISATYNQFDEVFREAIQALLEICKQTQPTETIVHITAMLSGPVVQQYRDEQLARITKQTEELPDDLVEIALSHVFGVTPEIKQQAKAVMIEELKNTFGMK